MISVTSQQELLDAIAANESEITIENNISLNTPVTITYNLTMTSGSSVISWSGNSGGTMFTVTGGAVFSLENIILDGLGSYVTLVDVAASVFIMNENTILRNVLTNSANKAVRIGTAANPTLGGTFIMNGGLITGVQLDAVITCTGGSITMNGNAAIAGNQAYGIGLQSSTLTMTGTSRISDNSAMRPAAGVLAYGNSVIHMGINEGDAPQISDNESLNSYSGGVYLVGNSILNMNYGAAIINNHSASISGGVGLNNATLNMNDQSSISGNTTGSGGGGIFATSGSRIMMAGQSSVSSNGTTDTGGLGGGIYLQLESSLTMTDSASVTDNQSETGGGIHLKTGTAATLTDQALVSNNTAGNGIFNEGQVFLSGGVRILDGLYFNAYELAPVIEDALTGEALIQLAASDYVAAGNITVTAAVKGNGYDRLSRIDSSAFLAPPVFAAGTPIYRNARLDEILIGLVVTINSATLHLKKLSG